MHETMHKASHLHCSGGFVRNYLTQEVTFQHAELVVMDEGILSLTLPMSSCHRKERKLNTH